jgi:hypothetical protein
MLLLLEPLCQPWTLLVMPIKIQSVLLSMYSNIASCQEMKSSCFYLLCLKYTLPGLGPNSERHSPNTIITNIATLKDQNPWSLESLKYISGINL